MTWENSAITITTLLPIVGALVIVMMPREKDRIVRGLGIVFTGAALVLAIAIAIGFDYGTDGLQYVLDVDWIARSACATTWASTASRCRCTC